jgi:hypothetical protein
VKKNGLTAEGIERETNELDESAVVCCPHELVTVDFEDGETSR